MPSKPNRFPTEKLPEKRKDLILFEGSLKDYAEMLLKEKRGDGSVFNLGEIHETVVKELSKRNIQLADTRIIVDQHSVTKYFAHPKDRKGAVLPIVEYELIEKAESCCQLSAFFSSRFCQKSGKKCKKFDFFRQKSVRKVFFSVRKV